MNLKVNGADVEVDDRQRTLLKKPFCDGTHATCDFDGTLAN
jgi:CDGSH-type Zn-finger protein